MTDYRTRSTWLAHRGWASCLLVGLTCIVTGCSFLGITFSTSDSDSDMLQGRRMDTWQGGTFRGDACAEVLQPDDRMQGPVTRDPSKRVLLAVCERQETVVENHHGGVRRYQEEAFRLPSPLETYAALNERDIEQLEAALALVELDLDLKSVRSALANAKDLGDSADSSSTSVLPKFALASEKLLLVSISETLRAVVDPRAVSAELDELDANVPPEARQEFRSLLDRAMNAPDTSKIPEAVRYLYFDVPRRVFEARRKHFADYASYYEALDHLLRDVENNVRAGQSAPDLEDELETLRTEFMRECPKNCVESPFAGAASVALARMSIIRDDPMNALSELAAYRSGDRFRVTYARAVGVAQQSEADQMRQRVKRMEKLMAKGMAASVAREKVEGPVGDVDVIVVSKAEAPDILDAVPTGAVSPIVAEVRRVRRTGDYARVEFAKARSVETKYFNCRRTNRVARVHADGRVEYEQRCDHKNIARVRPTEPDVLVPAAEAAGLRAGDRVRGFRQGERGRVPIVERDGNMVRWLGYALQ